jgi:hypothetical protein
LDTFGDDAFAWFETIGDNPIAAGAIADGDGADGNFVVIADYGDLVGTLECRNGALRNKQRIFLGANHGANATMPPGRNMFAGLGNRPARRIAPVPSFTWRSAK